MKHKFLRKLRRPIAFLLSVVAILGVVVGVVWLVVPELIEAVKIIVQAVVGFINKIKEMPESELAQFPLGNLLLEIDRDQVVTLASFSRM